jgi:hypothetical protein
MKKGSTIANYRRNNKLSTSEKVTREEWESLINVQSQEDGSLPSSMSYYCTHLVAFYICEDDSFHIFLEVA